MENHKQFSKFCLVFLLAFLAISDLNRVESKCVKRNFKYPTPVKKADSSERAQSSSSPPPPTEEKSSKSASETESESNNYKFGDMLKQVVTQINPSSPILDIPKVTVNDPDIEKFCESTDYPELCESTVSHFIEGRQHDAVAMLEMVIKACVQYTQLARATAKKLSTSPIFAKIKSRFVDIDEYYVDALDNLQDAENAINVKDIATVNINLSAALDDYGAYEDDWGETSPMVDFDMKLTHMASNCLAISTLVKF